MGADNGADQSPKGGGRIVAVYLPPATGFTPEMLAEVEAVRASGVGVLDFEYPSDQGGARGPASATGEVVYWDKVAVALAELIAGAGAVPVKCVLVGFNFGGSVAAYFATRFPVAGIVAAGSIPRLSEFWPNSDHRVAVAVRRKTGTIDPTFAEITRVLDLTESVRWLSVPILLQFGHADDWIDRGQAAELEALRPASCAVMWYEDDHAMTGATARQDRGRFMTGLASTAL